MKHFMSYKKLIAVEKKLCYKTNRKKFVTRKGTFKQCVDFLLYYLLIAMRYKGKKISNDNMYCIYISRILF
jgi:hypothetical protein